MMMHITKKDVSNEENRKELLNEIYTFCLKQLQEYGRTAKNIDISEFPDGALGLSIENDSETIDTLFRYDFQFDWDKIESQSEQDAERHEIDRYEALENNIAAEFDLEWDYVLKDKLEEFFEEWKKDQKERGD